MKKISLYREKKLRMYFTLTYNIDGALYNFILEGESFEKAKGRVEHFISNYYSPNYTEFIKCKVNNTATIIF